MRKARPNTTFSSSGFVLIEAMLVCVGIGFLAIASISLQETLSRNQAKVSIDTQLSEVRRMILENLNNPGIWHNLVENPANGIKACLASTKTTEFGACDYSKEQKMKLNVSSGSRLKLDPAEPKLGFDLNLSNCNTYGEPAEAATACPFRAVMTWKPLCTVTGECQQAAVAVDIEADPRFESLYSFAAETFSFTMKKNLSLKRNIDLPASRILNFTVDPLEPKKLEVYFIVDNSASLTDNRETLGQGMATFVDAMKGMDVEYKVYTTESMALAAPYSWPHELEDIPDLEFEPGIYTMKDGSTRQTMFGWGSGKPATGSYTSWTSALHLKADLGERWGMNLKQTHDQTDLSTIKNHLITALKQAETVAAGSAEAGLCTLTRLLYNKGPNNPIKPGENALFVILSDEDDAFVQQYGAGHKVCMGDVAVLENPDDEEQIWCDPANGEKCDGAHLYLRFPMVETVAETKLTAGDSIWWRTETVCKSANGKCGAPGVTRACTAKEKQPPNSSWKSESCIVKNTTIARELWLPLENNLSTGNVAPDLCAKRSASFTYDGKTFSGVSNFVIDGPQPTNTDYFPSDVTIPICKMNPYRNVIGAQPAFRIVGSDMPFSSKGEDQQLWATETDKVYKSIPARLRELYGREGYGLFSVVHDKAKDAAAGCTMNASSGSYGSKYLEIQSATDTRASYSSVCENDYSQPVMDMVARAKKIVKDSFVLDEFDPEAEQIYNVVVERAGSTIPVNASDYATVGQTLQFRAGVVTAGDKIQVVINAK